MLFGKLFTNPKMWVNGNADDITMGGVYTCKDVQNVPTGDGALFVFKTENTVKQVFIPVGEEGVVYTRVVGEEWASVTGTSEETEALIQSAIDKANQAQAKADTVNTRLNNIIVESGTSEAEVVAARTDSDGHTFTTLGERLDTQFGEIKEDLSAVSEKSMLAETLQSEMFEVGMINESGQNTNNQKRIRTKSYIAVSSKYNAIGYNIAPERRLYIFFYNSSQQLIKGTFWLLEDGVTFFPSGTRYIRYMVASIGDTTSLTPANNYNDVAISYGFPAVTEFNRIITQTKWLAFGDSITYGVYSTGVNTSLNSRIGWVNMLSGSLGYDITNMGSRGMGYMVTGNDPDNPSGVRVSFSSLVDRVISRGGDYNLITIMLGTNDFNTGGISLTSVQESLSTELEKLVTAYPASRVIVITPLNACNVGNTASKYALNHTSANSWTLAELASALKEICERYGVEFINVSDGFLLNTFNIAFMLPDKIHPAYNTHKLIAKSMAHYLLM